MSEQDGGAEGEPAPELSLASKTVRNTAMVAGSRFLSRLLVVYVFLLIARSVTTDNYGRFSLLVVLSSIVSVIVDIGLRPLFIREAAKDHRVLSPYLNSILSLKLVMTLPAFLVLFGAMRLLLPEDIGHALLPTLLLMLGASFANQTRATFYAIGELRYEAVATLGETLVLLGATIAVASQHLPWWYFIWAYAASWWFTVVFSSVVAVVRFRHRFAFDLDVARLSMLGRESLPFALSFVVSTLYYKIDQPIMKLLGVGLPAIGLYGAAYKFLDAATFIPQALMDPVYPALSRISHTSADRLPPATTKAYKMLAVAAVPTAIGMVALSGAIIRYGVGRGYEGAVPILMVLGLSVLFLFVNNTFIYTLNAMGRQRESTRLAVLSLIVNVALNLILIPQRNAFYGGAMGAAWATVLTEVALFAGGWYLLRRHLFALPVVRALGGVIPAGLLCAAAMGALILGLGPHLATYGLALLVGVAVYLGGLFGTHAFTADELSLAREGLKSLARR